MTQDELKQAVARAALDYVQGGIIGVGTGSTARLFIEALAGVKDRISGAVAIRDNTRRRLKGPAPPLLVLNKIDSMPVYIDGADEINAEMHMIKGGGGALTREKIVSAVAEKFICIADDSKYVEVLGRFPLPVEVIPMARAQISREIIRLGGRPVLREGFMTDNGNLIIDVHGLQILDPVDLETRLNQITGVVTNGLFARKPADVCLLGTEHGVITLCADGDAA